MPIKTTLTETLFADPDSKQIHALWLHHIMVELHTRLARIIRI